MADVKTFNYPQDPAASVELYRHFCKAFDVDGQTEAGVFLSTVGSLGGFAAQQAVWKSCIEPGGRNAGDFLVMVRTKSGETLYLGEAVNLFLRMTQRGHLSFYSLVAGAVPNPGPATLPDVNEIFAHVAQSMGKPNFWQVRLPEHHGLFPSPRAVLERHWAATQEILVRHGNPASEWPVILGVVAHRTLKASIPMVGPGLAPRLVMEAAIIAAKADPRTVPGATAGLNPPAQWSNRALRPETQNEVIAEVLRFIPTKVPR